MDTTELDRQIAEQTLENFVERFGVAHLRLAQYAAIPLILTPELVGFLRSRFLRGQVLWIAEADLLLSDLCRQVGYERFVMEPAIRAHLLGGLGSEAKQEVASLLLHYVAYLVREKRYLTETELETQQWAAMIYLNDRRETVVNQIMDKFRQLVEETSSRGEGSLYTEMNRLARLVKEFEPQLLKYPEVLEYAKEVGEARNIRELKSITVPSLSKQPIEAIPLETAIDTPPGIELFTEEVESVTVTFINLKTFSYEVGMLEIVKSRNLLRQESKKFQIKKQTQQGQQLVEQLGSGTTLEMVVIPAGKFIMGAPKEEEDSLDSERPQHEVSVAGFLMGKYPITQAQWRVVAGMPQIERELELDPSNFKGNNFPVEQVSWLDAVEFCKRLSIQTGREYKLPSEAEWEYACRAMPSPPRSESPRADGTFKYDGSIASGILKTTGQIYPPFHFGETITTELVNYDGDYPYGEAPKSKARNKTTPVGSFPANAFGLYDMHGNVWEWCEDDWHGNYEGAPKDGRAWIDKNDNRSQEEGEIRKLLRGGSWDLNARNCRSAFRDDHHARYQFNLNGFRVVCRLQ